MNPHKYLSLLALPSLTRGTSVAITLLSAAALAPSSLARAQSLPACTAQDCAADFMQFDVNDIQYSPGLFKLQARISQAKIPVGDAIFDQILVNLVRPGAQNRVACAESIPNVRVRNSVLNLDIGRQMTSCELDQVIAQESDLAFEICINSPDNCLKPIPLGSTPYAIKSSYAVTAQKAHAANQCVQSHYAHRVTADTELFVGERDLEDGYFDFATPDPNNQATPATTGWESISDTLKSHMKSVYGAGPDTIYDSPVGGFIQWTPVNPVETGGTGDGLGTLHLVAKDENDANKVLKPLAKMMIHAEETYVTGDLHVLVRGANDTIVTAADVSAAGLSVSQGEGVAPVSQEGIFLRTEDAQISVTGGTAALSGGASSAELSDAGFNVSQGVAPATETGIHLRTADAQISIAGGTAALSSGASSVSVDGDGLLCSADAQFGAIPDGTTLDIYSYTRFHGTVEIPTESVQASLGEGSVSSFEIADTTIQGYSGDESDPGDIAYNTVDSWNIKNNSITGDDIAYNTVDSRNITNNSITGADIMNGTITGVDIAANAVTASKIAANSVVSSAIAADAVGASEIAANAVGTSEIEDGSITSVDIDSEQVQRRVSGSCDAGYRITSINSDGSFNCRYVTYRRDCAWYPSTTAYYDITYTYGTLTRYCPSTRPLMSGISFKNGGEADELDMWRIYCCSLY